MAVLAPGSRLGPYEIVAPLGQGGMGEVYRAHDTRLDREVAIKVLPEAAAGASERVERFQREAKAAAALNHPNLLALFDVGVHENSPYLVSELLPGETLRQLLKRGRLPWRRALGVAADLARGLAAAHDSGVVHRDLKPANVFILPDGRAKILDFGLSTFASPAAPADRLAEAETLERLTQPGLILGTAGYMAPEQIAGQPVDGRADVFSLGVILHEMLAGSRPFAGSSLSETLRDTLEKDPPDLEAGERDLPEGLGRVVRHCLEKRPENRFQTARDVLFGLEGILGSSRPPASPPPSRARPWLTVGAVLVVALLVAWLARRWLTAGGAVSARSIAVLPFRPRGEQAAGIGYLSLAIPDEIATLLSYAPNLAVRPFTDSSRFTQEPLDLERVGRELGADRVVVGQFGIEGTQLRISAEAVSLADHRVLWRDSWGVGERDLTGLRDVVRERVGSGLLPALGHEGRLLAGASRGPASEESYGLFLRAAGLSMDPSPNRDALPILERAVALDPSFAPAWLELSRRSYADNLLGGGGEAQWDKAVAAASRAVALDPDLLPAAVNKIGLDTNAGRLVDAFRAADELTRRRPASAQAHFTRSYVLRYGGEVQASARECLLARSLDASDPGLWSCNWTFLFLPDYQEAEAFATLARAQRPQLIASVLADVAMRAGDRVRARTLMTEVPDELTGAPLQRACLQDPKPAEVASLAARYEAENAGLHDSEVHYWAGALLADCGFADAAFRFLARSIDGGYCSCSGLDADPLWGSVRSRPEFLELRKRARECRDRFLAATKALR